jgi:hypothetical protein
MAIKRAPLLLVALIAGACSSTAAPSWSFGPAGTPAAAAAAAAAATPSPAPATAAPTTSPAPATPTAAAPTPTTAPPTATPAPSTPALAPLHADSVLLTEFHITIAGNVLAAGKVTFAVTNAGTIGHEFVIKRTDLPDTALPLRADGTIDEESTELGQVGEIEVPKVLSTDPLTLTLTPGNYVFFCNIPGHYAGGMHGTFTVVGQAGAPAPGAG